MARPTRSTCSMTTMSACIHRISRVCSPVTSSPARAPSPPYQAGATLPGPGAGPGSILVRSNVNAAAGDTSQAIGTITFSSPPTGFTFASNDEFEEHQVLEVPAGGSVSLSYIYSTGYGVAQVQRTRARGTGSPRRPVGRDHLAGRRHHGLDLDREPERRRRGWLGHRVAVGGRAVRTGRPGRQLERAGGAEPWVEHDHRARDRRRRRDRSDAGDRSGRAATLGRLPSSARFPGSRG